MASNDELDQASDNVLTKMVQRAADEVGAEIGISHLMAIVDDDGQTMRIRIEGTELDTLSDDVRADVVNRIMERLLS